MLRLDADQILVDKLELDPDRPPFCLNGLQLPPRLVAMDAVDTHAQRGGLAQEDVGQPFFVC